MDWLAKLPLIGPVLRWLTKTHAFRAYQHYSDRKGDRLAGSVTYFGFLSVFPIIAVASAIGAAVLSDSRLATLQEKIAEQVPGISDQLDLEKLAQNAGTIGVVGLLILLYSGLGGVAAARGSLRAVWGVPEDPGNPFLRKLLDLFVMVGLLIAITVTLGGSALATAGAGQAAEWLGVRRSGAGAVGLSLLGYVIAVAAGFGLFCYLLTWLPLLRPPRRAVLGGALIGAIGFEVLKGLLSGYLTGVADKGVYGAFGVPVALLLWMNFAVRLLLLCAAWTATAAGASPDAADRLHGESEKEDEKKEEKEGDEKEKKEDDAESESSSASA